MECEGETEQCKKKLLDRKSAQPQLAGKQQSGMTVRQLLFTAGMSDRVPSCFGCH